MGTGLSVFIGKGQIGAFDDIAEALVAKKKTVAEATSAAEALLKDTEVVTDDDDKANAEYYIKTIKRIDEKGEDYPKKELAPEVNDRQQDQRQEERIVQDKDQHPVRVPVCVIRSQRDSARAMVASTEVYFYAN